MKRLAGKVARLVTLVVALLVLVAGGRTLILKKKHALVQAPRYQAPTTLVETATVIGLSPLIFEMAVGLERISPLEIVAASGLLGGAFLTMIIVPVFYSGLETISNTFQNTFRSFGIFLDKERSSSS